MSKGTASATQESLRHRCRECRGLIDHEHLPGCALGGGLGAVATEADCG